MQQQQPGYPSLTFLSSRRPWPRQETVPAVIWFEGLGDSGCVVSLANYFDGTSSGIDSVLLNSIELKFNSVLMGASGQLAIDEAEKVYQGTPPYDVNPMSWWSPAPYPISTVTA